MDSSNLLNRVGLLDEQARIAFLLKYYYGFPYKKIAQYLLISERKVKQISYSSLIIWTNNGRLVPTDHIEDVIKREVSLIKNILQENLVLEKKNQYIGTRTNRKTPIIILTLLFLLVGGSINEETLGKTRVSLGPDVYKYYKEGGIFQLDKEIQDKGYQDIYTYPEFDTNTLIVQFYTPDSVNKKEEITTLIESYLKERDLDYEIKYEEFTQVVEVEETEEQKAENKVMEMQLEILELVTAKPYYYMQSFIGEESGESMEIIVSDTISEEEETDLKGEIKNIIKKYDLEWNFTIGKIEEEVVKIEKAISDIYPALAEAYIFSKNKYNVYDMYPYYVNGVLEFNVYTGLSLSTNEEVAQGKEILNELRRSLHFFLQHEDIQDLINHVPYVIKVYGKDGNEVQIDT